MRILRLLGLGAGLAMLAGCGSKMASQNPLGPVASVAGSNLLCPARYSFEAGSASLSNWFCPPWLTGISQPVTDTAHVTCGLYSVKFTCNFPGGDGNNNVGQIQTAFPLENDTNKILTMNVYFSSTPPPQFGITAAFIDQRTQNPIPGPVWDTQGYKQGWNQYWTNFRGSDVSQSVGLYLKFTGDMGQAWTGTIWIDDINW